VKQRKALEPPDPSRLSDAQIGDVCGVNKATAWKWHKEGLKKRPKIEELVFWLAHRTGYAPESQSERLRTAQAEKVELENRRRNGELIEVHIIVAVLNTLAADLAARHDAMAGRTASIFAGMTDASEIRKRLLDETRAIRSAFATATQELADAIASADPVLEDHSTAAGEDSGPVGGSVPDLAEGKR